jgi:hypothetical protein
VTSSEDFRSPQKKKKERGKTEAKFTGNSGEIFFEGATSIPKDEDIRRIISEAGRNPDEYIWELTNISWDTAAWHRDPNDKGINHSATTAPRCIAKFKITRKPETVGIESADIDSLVALVSKKRPTKTLAIPGNDSASFVALLSDWQLGKGEGGGSPAITQNILDSLDKSLVRAKSLRKIGKGSEEVFLLGLGDIVEGCSGWYPMMEFSVDLNNREQDRLARHLILQWIDGFVDAAFGVTILGAAGNHGEARANGKAYTSFDDNRDVQAFEIVNEILLQNPSRYGNVKYPEDKLDITNLVGTLEISGMKVSIAHGHQFSGGTNSTAKAEGWWKGQALGRQQVADSDILFSGHFHHFIMSEATGRLFCQAPASENSSQWFTARSGQSSPSGVLTLRIGKDLNNRGWDDVSIV